MSEKPKSKLSGLNPASIPSSLRKSPTRYSRSSVLKMLAVMEQASSKNNEMASTSATSDEQPTNGQVNDFLSTGRTGRRNALPDILNEHAHVTSSDLPARLQALTTKDTKVEKKEAQPSTSNSSD